MVTHMEPVSGDDEHDVMTCRMPICVETRRLILERDARASKQTHPMPEIGSGNDDQAEG